MNARQLLLTDFAKLWLAGGSARQISPTNWLS